MKFSSDGECIYCDPKTGKELVNPSNGEKLSFIDYKGDFTTNIGSSKAEGKKKMVNHLEKRSHEHFKKEIAPVKSAMIAGSAAPKS